MEKRIVDRYILARKHLGFTLEYIANELDCSKGLINAIECDKVEEPNFKYVKFLVSKGINFDYLLGKSDVMLVSNIKDSSVNSNLENTALREALEHERLEKEDLENRLKNMEGTINYLMGELEKLKKIQQKTWAIEPNSTAVMGKSKTVSISGNGHRFSVSKTSY